MGILLAHHPKTRNRSPLSWATAFADPSSVRRPTPLRHRWPNGSALGCCYELGGTEPVADEASPHASEPDIRGCNRVWRRDHEPVFGSKAPSIDPIRSTLPRPGGGCTA